MILNSHPSIRSITDPQTDNYGNVDVPVPPPSVTRTYFTKSIAVTNQFIRITIRFSIRPFPTNSRIAGTVEILENNSRIYSDIYRFSGNTSRTFEYTYLTRTAATGTTNYSVSLTTNNIGNTTGVRFFNGSVSFILVSLRNNPFIQ